jgi:hypothetical protein
MAALEDFFVYVIMEMIEKAKKGKHREYKRKLPYIYIYRFNELNKLTEEQNTQRKVITNITRSTS